MFDTVLIDTVTRLLLFNVFGSYFNGRVLVRGLRSSKRRASWRLGPLTVSHFVRHLKFLRSTLFILQQDQHSLYQQLYLHGLSTFAIKNNSFEKVSYSFHVVLVPLKLISIAISVVLISGWRVRFSGSYVVSSSLHRPGTPETDFNDIFT